MGHVIGPDFRTRSYTREEAVSELAIAYGNVFTQLHASGLRKLRLLPVSGGIFSGPFISEVSAITAEALEESFSMLSADVMEWISGAQIDGFRRSGRAALHSKCRTPRCGWSSWSDLPMAWHKQSRTVPSRGCGDNDRGTHCEVPCLW